MLCLSCGEVCSILMKARWEKHFVFMPFENYAIFLPLIVTLCCVIISQHNKDSAPIFLSKVETIRSVPPLQSFCSSDNKMQQNM